MKKSVWDEKRVEAALQNLPKVEDQRSAQMIYSQLNARERRGNQYLKRFHPTAVAVLAIAIFTIISASLIFNDDRTSVEYSSDNNNSTIIESEDEAASEPLADYARKEENGITNAGIAEGEKNILESQPMSNIDLLFPSDLSAQSYMTLAIPTLDAQYVIPVTILVDAESLGETIQQQKVVEDGLNEINLGLSDYFPLQAQFSYMPNEKAIVVDIPLNHPYFYEDRLFMDILFESYRYQDVDRIVFKTDGQEGAEFSHIGFLEETDIQHHLKRAIYLYQYEENQLQLFVPSINSYQNISEAYDAMKVGDDPEYDSLSMAIPSSVQFDSFEENGDQLIVTFSNETVLENSGEYEIAIEAMLLGAREFGYESVLFKNANVDLIGLYQLSQEIEVPIAPNVIEIE